MQVGVLAAGWMGCCLRHLLVLVTACLAANSCRAHSCSEAPAPLLQVEGLHVLVA